MKGKINTFAELMDEISYSWNDCKMERYEKGAEVHFVLNKLYIEPTLMTYKTSEWDLEPGVCSRS
mgnify:CR=1 FL=1